MTDSNALPSVRNGEPCPQCGTPIFGKQPNQCFMCSYDFTKPGNPLTGPLPEPVRDPFEIQAEQLGRIMDNQREIEKGAQERLDGLVETFLQQPWPEDQSERTWTRVFMEAVRQWWPQATFYNVTAEAWWENSERRWYKRLRGSMDLTGDKIVGFQFDAGLKRDPGAAL